jgi:TonB family protein
MIIRHSRCGAIAACFLLALGRTSAMGQDPPAVEERARQLYIAAAYEDALAVLGLETRPEAQQYRALCLLALGRHAEATTAVEALVTAAPDFTVSEDMPPRFVRLLDDARVRLLPSILRGLLTQGRQHYHVQDYEQARARFERIVALTSQPALQDLSDVSDVRLLADGYLDLLRGARPQQPPLPEPAPAAAPGGAPVPEIRTAPSPVRQVLPSWPADAGQIDRARVGLLRVRIGSSGQVLSATLIRSVHPRYDLQLLVATKKWRYRPATQNGVPVESESTIEIRPEAPSR